MILRLLALLLRALARPLPPEPAPRPVPVEHDVVRAMGGLSIGCPCGERALFLKDHPRSEARLEAFRAHRCEWGWS